MFKNYLKIALRNLIKQKGYTIINVLGLAIGMVACILILIYIQHELSYDNFHEKGERIVRIVDNWSAGDISENLAVVPFPVAPTLQLEYPETVENYVRLYRPSSWNNTVVISYGEDSFVENGVMFADSTFFDLFDFKFARGSGAVLDRPGQVVVTKEIANKYFGDENPIGKRLQLNQNVDLQVGAVLADFPENSHIQFDFLSNTATLTEFWGGWTGYKENWTWTACWTYLLLNDAQASEMLESELSGFVQRHFPHSIKDDTELLLQAFPDIYLHSQRYYEIAANGNITYVYIFSAIAILILLIACINFMNLSTARSAARAKEIGMRKVLGAYRTNLIRQFLGETVMVSIIALLLAIAVLEVILPGFNALIGKELEINYFGNWTIPLGLLFVGLFAGLIAGSYPAFFLSRFRPVKVLKGSASVGTASNRSESSLRKILVVSQFVVSLVLLIGIGVIHNQLNYLQNKDLGFNREQVLFFERFQLSGDEARALKNRLQQHKDIIAVSALGSTLPGNADGVANAYIPEGAPEDQPRWISVMRADHDFEKILGLEVIAGRSFSTAFPTDSTDAVLINETAVNDFGWTLDTAVGKTLRGLDSRGQVNRTVRVIGVVRDFFIQPLHESLKPLIIPFGAWDFAVRISPHDVAGTMNYIQDTWGDIAPQWPLNYRFLDNDLAQLYEKEQKLGQIIRAFTFLAIFVACLGLFGLASFTAERRTKEIGLRKVLGASITSVVLLIAKDFTKLVLVAFILASPIAYWAMNKWLQSFAYRVDIEWWLFVIAGAAAMIIALVTVGAQAIKAALSNPVNSLRYE